MHSKACSITSVFRLLQRGCQGAAAVRQGNRSLSGGKGRKSKQLRNGHRDLCMYLLWLERGLGDLEHVASAARHT